MQPILLQDETTERDEADEQSGIFYVSVSLSEPTIVQPTADSLGYAYVTYLVTAQTNTGATLRVRRRYSDFRQLDRALRMRFGKEMSILVKFPPKTGILVNTLDAKFVKRRMADLELWLASVVLNPVVAKCSEVALFFTNS